MYFRLTIWHNLKIANLSCLQATSNIEVETRMYANFTYKRLGGTSGIERPRFFLHLDTHNLESSSPSARSNLRICCNTPRCNTQICTKSDKKE
jgi:hypothetical protein